VMTGGERADHQRSTSHRTSVTDTTEP
jgi:hypothetical protein